MMQPYRVALLLGVAAGPVRLLAQARVTQLIDSARAYRPARSKGRPGRAVIRQAISFVNY